MSEPTVVVVESGEPAEVQAQENAADVTVALVAGAAAEKAEEACEDAAEAVAVAAEAVAVAEAAAVTCCAHCEDHAMRLSSLEEGRAAELAAAVEEEALDAPAPEMRQEPVKREAPKKQAPPAKKSGGFWPLG